MSQRKSDLAARSAYFLLSFSYHHGHLGIIQYILASVCCVVFKPLYFAFVLYRARLVFYPHFNMNVSSDDHELGYHLPANRFSRTV
jgi:hypothetical protein